MSWSPRLLRRRTLAGNLAGELEFHLDVSTDDFVRAGRSRAKPRRFARKGKH
jgi:hypothetical protein